MAVILNGEIYNFQELRAELEARGHRFADALGHRSHRARLRGVRRPLRGAAARHVRLRALGRRGAAAAAGPRPRRQEAALLPPGRRRGSLFGSELKALLQDPSLKRAVNLEALDAYLSLGAVPAPLTIFQDVSQLPPAHYLVWESGGIHGRRVLGCRRTGATVERSERQALEELGAVFDEGGSRSPGQ